MCMMHIYRLDPAIKLYYTQSRHAVLRGHARMTTSHADGIAEIERELTLLIRAVEAVRRHRTYPMEPAQYLHMRTLIAEGPQTVAALAARLCLDSSTVTRQVAAMEAAGFVRKAPHPTDSRSHLIVPTESGCARTEEMGVGRRNRLGEALAGWSTADRKEAARLMGGLSRAILGQIAGDADTANA